MINKETHYHSNGTYVGEELIGYFGCDIEIGDDENNGVYVVRFSDGNVYDNIFEEEINFKID
jgi:hypothetical protein